jgi:cytochrome c biogenesis protein CcmG/thiol:disulfide interchange protein DsbE
MLLEIARHYQIPIYGLNFREKPDMAKAYLEKMGDPFIMVGMDTTGKVASRLGVDAAPQTFLVDKQGRIRYHHAGTLSKSMWEEVLLPLVRKYMEE